MSAYADPSSEHRSGVAVVTGGAGGLGLEIARALHRRGHLVQITDVDADRAQAAADHLGPGASSAPLDVTDAAACGTTAHAARQQPGGLGVWVNNAGILPTGYVWDHDEGDRRSTLEVNALGTINGTLAALEVMRAAGHGHVINVVSLAGLAVAPGEALYSASKHAALAFSLGALYDLRRTGITDVHVSALCPDGIWTPMLYDKVDDPDAAMSWSGVLLDPADAAQAAIGLLDRPRPVLALPRWRGWVARALALSPALALRTLPAVIASARRKQAAFKQRAATGDDPIGQRSKLG